MAVARRSLIRNAAAGQRIIVHVMCDLARHAGHADIMREQLDGMAGLRPGNTNLPDDFDWPAYVARVTATADRFAT